MKRKLKEMTCAFLDFSDIFDKIAIVFRKKHVTCEKKFNMDRPPGVNPKQKRELREQLNQYKRSLSGNKKQK